MSERETWIDSLKGISILLVLLPHCGLNYLPGKIGQLCGFGQFGIIPFFIISSYLAFTSYSRFLSRGEPWRKWFIHKVIRLIPLYYLALIPAIIYGGDSYWLNGGKISLFNILTHLTLTHGLFPNYCNSILGVEWYIGVLAIFYFFVPLFFKFIDTFEKSIAILLGSIFLFTAFPSIFSHYEYGTVTQNFFQRFSFGSELPVLLMGLCVFHAKSFLDNYKRRSHSLFVYVAMISILILLLGQAFSKNHLYRVGDLYLCGLLFAGLIFVFCISHFRVLDNILFRFIGKHSYPMYLFHMIILHFLDLFFNDYDLMHTETSSLFLKYLIVFSLSLFFSFLSIRYVETPVIRILEKKALIV